MQSKQSDNTKNARPTLSSTSSSNSMSSQSRSTRNPSLTPTPNLPTFNKISTTGDPSLAKKRTRNLLRDYYGLSNQVQSQSQSPTPNQTEEMNDMDSTSFNHQLWFQKLTHESSLDLILLNANKIISEIRELDGERQSLVYNHHHELVDASVTIGKMKTSAETLDSTLDSLQNSFSSISEITTSISNSFSTKTPSSSSSKPKENSNLTKDEEELSNLILPLLSLPIILKSLTNQGQKTLSDQLWGEWEIILRSFEEIGIENIKKIGNECREILRQGRNLK